MKRAGTSQQLRIIGGQWRGRKLRFPALPGLRPTPDRVRETLFNWLSPLITGARCLDLFAGSGALGIEALSRGAARVVFVENDARASKTLRENLHVLQTDAAAVIAMDAQRWLKQAAPMQVAPDLFDIVFLDPPFAQDYLNPICQALEDSGCLAANALIYLESEIRSSVLLPANWTVLRDKTAGQVHYRLARREVPIDANCG
ncbi:MAG: 16S rRNA (guanine(966)-N(2))-methyltransferase RsmD [Candidatus Competibacteraceae bacterium]|nr:16S rRNA (guanine(966)-N(2))-methyltransferase RsmD [Candidatus Competibacteraceae bacterium]MCB1814049.1 16S rRNA (guanine(966)-N(2))-methyltransferase RsmD [Candidatus Competibacteraceae bacterium]